MFIGHVAMSFSNGKSVAGEFTGRLRVENATSSQPRLLLYQVWAVSLKPPQLPLCIAVHALTRLNLALPQDSAPVTKALQGN